jgi:glycosyltransferase involved in cell wall biosynthesis
MASAQLSALIPVRGDHADLEGTFRAYQAALDEAGRPYEMIWLFDARRADVGERLKALKAGGRRITLVGLSRWLGEAAAVSAGLRHARGQIILMLPGHSQVDPSGIRAALEALEDSDMVIGRRTPLSAPASKRVQARLFHNLVERLFGVSFQDIGCRLRVCRRAVLEEIGTYGTQYRFLPLIASQRGFRVREVDVAPGPNGNYSRLSALDYLRRLLDVLALFLLLKFTKRPLRFFGPVGFGVLAPGLALTAALAAARLLFDVPLADRPALMLGVLMIVLGIQIVAVGLIGEIIIFAHGRQIKDQAVERVVEGLAPRPASKPV